MIIIVAYDISRSDKRDRVAKILQSLGLTRLQRSLYAGRGGVARARDIARVLDRVVDKSTDVVDIVLVPDNLWYNRIVVGSGRRRVPGYATLHSTTIV